MIHCKNCHAWRPAQWEGWQWIDKEAPCIYYDHPVLAEGWCEKSSITVPHKGVNNDRLPTVHVSATATVRKTSDDIRSDSDFSSDNPSSEYLFRHQQEDFEFFKDKSAIPLFGEMGTGKSATILAVAAYKFEKREINALLIIAPNDVHRQWAMEQCPLWLRVPYDMQCFGGRGGARKTYPFVNDPEMLQVVCVNIDTFSTPAKWKDVVDWANHMKTMIILDEATCIKSINAQRTQRLLYAFNRVLRKGKTVISSQMNTIARAILTGTPVTNGPMDLWSMIEFVWPNYFQRNWYSFQNYYGMYTKLDINDRVINIPLNEDRWHAIKECMTFEEANAIFGCSQDTFDTIHSQSKYEGPYKHADELKALLYPIARFHLLKDCIDMPEQNYSTSIVSMSDEQRECYDSMVNEYIATYRDHTASALNKMTAIIRLQQISSGFICDKNYITEETDEDDITPDDPIQWIGKSCPKLDALYRDVDECAKPLIIITRYSAEAARIFSDMDGKFRCSLVTGWKRVGTIEEFKQGKYDIMVANIAAIARGFNLQNSYTMLFYSNTHSLELRIQAEGRIYRIGQKERCEYRDYINDDSIDEKIIASIKMKRNLLDFIRGAEMEEIVA
jgi:SNF2 family DNA or RNA helicase